MKIYNTHAGVFHCDEITGYVITQLAGVCDQLIRDNDTSPMDNSIMADKGRIYDPENGFFDHHQLDLSNPQPELVRDNGIPYATAGLLWKKYGKHICGSKEVADRVEKTFIEAIDANDASGSYKVVATCSNQEIRVSTLPRLISSLNYEDPAESNLQFLKFSTAAEIIKIFLEQAIEHACRYFKAKDNFGSILNNARPESSKILILSEFVKWKEIVHDDYPKALVVIYPHQRSPYAVEMVTKKPNSREFRHSSGITRPDWFEGFIHASGFIAGCDSEEEAIQLAHHVIHS